jgi:ADP-ribose pyrophosphatase YjhB (NUDIX family)
MITVPKKTFPTGAQVVILNEDTSQVLLVKREDFRVWTIPGGRIEPGELPEEAAQREALEETGFSVRTNRFIGEYWRPQMPKGGALVFAFVAHVTGGDSSKHDRIRIQACNWSFSRVG